MREEFERARRYSLSFSLILLGIDELRGVRDRAGIRGGRQAQGATWQTYSAASSGCPTSWSTYGSNEFAIVLPETGQTGARQSVHAGSGSPGRGAPDGDPRLEHPRFSAGIVTYPHPAVSQTEELYAMAEAALMRGKAQSGRADRSGSVSG